MNMNEIHWEVKSVFPNEMRTDERYQRQVKDSLIKRIIANWDINLFNMPKLSLRDDGYYYIMDGDHSVTAWKYKFGNKPIQCLVARGLTWQEEARLFIAQRGESAAVTQKEKLNTRYNLNEPSIVNMVTIAKECGVTVVFSKVWNANGKCNATDAMYSAYQMVGDKVFRDVLDVIMQTWAGEKESLQAGFLKGISKFFELYNGRFQKKALIESLKKFPPEWYIRESKNMTNGTMQTRYCKVFLKVYNKCRTANRLPDML